ncbi:MAG: hypothetical protein ACD_75C01308G0001 [uncultured bacterium]|nr:MAG: hypothetical protein ACD_75C01308G0001 [uncultured bacterium]
MTLVNGVIPREPEMGVDPEGNPGLAGLVGDHRDNRPLQNLCRVEDIVDLFTLDQTVDMNTGPGDVEIRPHKWEIRRNPNPDLLFEIAGNVSDDGRIDPV